MCRILGLSLQAGLSQPEPVRVVPAGQLPVSPGDLRFGGLPGDAEHIVADLRAAVQALHQRCGRRERGHGEQENREPPPRRHSPLTPSKPSAGAAAPLRDGSHLHLHRRLLPTRSPVCRGARWLRHQDAAGRKADEASKIVYVIREEDVLCLISCFVSLLGSCVLFLDIVVLSVFFFHIPFLLLHTFGPGLSPFIF